VGQVGYLQEMNREALSTEQIIRTKVFI